MTNIILNNGGVYINIKVTENPVEVRELFVSAYKYSPIIELHNTLDGKLLYIPYTSILYFH